MGEALIDFKIPAPSPPWHLSITIPQRVAVRVSIHAAPIATSSIQYIVVRSCVFLLKPLVPHDCGRYMLFLGPGATS